MVCVRRLVFVTAMVFLAALRASGQDQGLSKKRPIGVADVIAMTRLAGDDSFLGGDSGGRVASFSPDARRFAVVLRKGNWEKNTNEFSVDLFETEDAIHSPRPDVLLTMASSSNRDAIRMLKWLDNENIAFLGENPGEVAQVYTFNLRTRRLKKRTHHPQAITSYDISSDGREIVFAADSPPTKITEAEETRRSGIVIADQDLSDLLAGDCAKSWEKQLFFESEGQPPVRMGVTDAIFDGDPLSLSPDGRYALVGVLVRDMPPEWKAYQVSPIVAAIEASETWKGQYTSLSRYLLLDSRDRAVTPLWNAPMLGFNRSAWAADSRSVFIRGAYLPLDVADPTERQEREKRVYDVAVKISSKEYRKITAEDWPKPSHARPDEAVTLEEQLDTPPRIYVSHSKTNQKVMLMDLNPQFDELQFGIVKTLHWNVRGVEVVGGLYLPPDYALGKRYPLVIQTHGFVQKQFSMDGRSEWSSGFAARPLAARGIIVLQAYDFANRRDHDNIENGTDTRFGAPPSRAARNLCCIRLRSGNRLPRSRRRD